MKVETIADQLYFTTIHITSFFTDGPPAVGTGFAFQTKKGEKSHLVLVTNKHVVEGAESGVLRFHLKDGEGPKAGKGFALKVEKFGGLWVGHRDKDVDVAVMSLSLVLEHAEKSGLELFFKTIPQEICPTPEQIEEFDSVEQVTFVGYPNGIYDQANYLPVVRRGITASPVQVDHDGRPKFLIDAAVFGGSSGSPVFLIDKGMYSRRAGGTVLGSRIHLLGIVAAVYFQRSDNEVVESVVPTGRRQLSVETKHMLNLGIVYKARTIVEAASVFVG